jgi:hypothetical protein
MHGPWRKQMREMTANTCNVKPDYTVWAVALSQNKDVGVINLPSSHVPYQGTPGTVNKTCVKMQHLAAHQQQTPCRQHQPVALLRLQLPVPCITDPKII